MPHLTYDLPAEIDGPTERVREAAVAQLRRVTAAHARLVELTNVQIRSSYLSALLRHDPALTPEELSEAWEASAEAGRCARMEGAAKLVERLSKSV